MVVRVYISGISGNKEVKKRQQRVTMILDSKNIDYTVLDIAEPGNENDKEFMQENSKARDSKHPLPPQIFNGNHYCGDYEEFDMANELDELEKFLKLSTDTISPVIENGVTNGSKIEIVKGDSLKEGVYESSEEIVSNVNHFDVEAVSIGKDVQNVPDETLHEPDDISKNPDAISKNFNVSKDPDGVFKDPDVISKDLDGVSKDLDDISKDPDLISSDLTKIQTSSDSSQNDVDKPEGLSEDESDDAGVDNSSVEDSVGKE